MSRTPARALLRRTTAAATAVVACLSVLAACTVGAPAGEREFRESAGRPGCRGVQQADVLGRRPPHAKGPLARFANHRKVCAALWLKWGEGRYGPQGLVLDGQTAWVSGWHRSLRLGSRACRLQQVELRTGRTLRTLRSIEGSVGSRLPTHCRHGGGLALTDAGLWVVETHRLWLLEPDLIGTGTDPVLRVWGIVEPLRGSIIAEDGGRLGLGEYVADHRGRISWFRIDDLLDPDVLDLVRKGVQPQPGQLSAVSQMRAPRRLQGATTDPDGRGLWTVSSTTTCGVLRTPRGRRIGFVPGGEALEFDRAGDLWVVSESGSWVYNRQGRPLVPMLLRLDGRAVARRGTPPDCDL